MNTPFVSAPNVWRNNSCNLNRILDRLEQGPFGGFDNMGIEAHPEKAADKGAF